VAKKRQARLCGARRTDGEPCGGWAMLAQDVCAAHGGKAERAKQAAYRRHVEARLRRAFEHDWAQFQTEVFEWNVRRVAFAAVTLGIPVEKVTEADVWWAYSEAGRKSPPPPELRRDRRFKTPSPPAYKPKRRAANSSTNGAE